MFLLPISVILSWDNWQSYPDFWAPVFLGRGFLFPNSERFAPNSESLAFCHLIRLTFAQRKKGNMNNTAEQWVSSFYNNGGWQVKDGVTEDARQFEDLRDFAQEYVSQCRLRVKEHLPASGDKLLDMGSGPIQFSEYLQFSENFKKHVCVDLSSHALHQARLKLGSKGEYINSSFFKTNLEENSFDAVISQHVIYHIDKNKQSKAVSKLLDAVKPGQKVILVYHNPASLFQWVERFFRLSSMISNRLGFAKKEEDEGDGGLYFHAHSRAWWNRFESRAKVEQFPWRSMTSTLQKKLVPNNSFGKKLLSKLFKAESKYPRLFMRISQYNMIVLTKNNEYGV